MPESAPAARGLARLIGLSLTGVDLPLAEADSAQQVAAELTLAGWDAERIAGVRAARASAGAPWPLPVDPTIRGAVGAAQLHTACQAVIAELGLVGPARLRDRHAELAPRDRALLAERPPHHGSVG